MSSLVSQPNSVTPSGRRLISSSGYEVPSLQEHQLNFPSVVENAATAFGDTADTDTTSKHLDAIKEQFEGLKSLFLRVKSNGAFLKHLEKDSPFEALEKENNCSQESQNAKNKKMLIQSRNELVKKQAQLRHLADESHRARSKLSCTTSNLADAYRQAKRKFEETEQVLVKFLNKKQKVSTASSNIVTALVEGNKTGASVVEDENAETVDSCQAILTAQTSIMQQFGEEEVTLQQTLQELESKLKPLKQDIETLHAIVEGGEAEEQDYKEELNDIRNVNNHMETMKLWYTNVMGFAQTIQGVTLDIDMTKVNEPDSWKKAFDDNQIKLKLVDDTISHTLKLQFEPKSSRLSTCELIPADIPIDDILSASKSLSINSSSSVTKNDSIKMLIREIRMRLQAKRKRESEIMELKQLYPAVRIVFKKDSYKSNSNAKNRRTLETKSTSAAQFLNVHVTIPNAIVVCLEVDADYPLPYTRPYITELVGVMGWSDDEIRSITEKVRSAKKKSMKDILVFVENLAKKCRPDDGVKVDK